MKLLTGHIPLAGDPARRTLLLAAALGLGAAAGPAARGQSSIAAPASTPAPWSGAGALGLGSCTPDWIAAFGGPGAVNTDVNALQVFDDGSGSSLYAAGLFTTAGGVFVRYVAEWDGSRWQALGGGLSGGSYVGGYDLTVFDDGSGPVLVVGGAFLAAGDVPAANVAMWDGTNWSAVASSMGNAPNPQQPVVHAVAAFDDGSGPALYVGGFFTSIDGVPLEFLGRWDGSSWTALGSGVDGPVECLAVHDDGSGPALYAGGYFSTAGGVTAPRIARWDGASWSAVGGGASNRVDVLESHDLDSDGRPELYAGGLFPSIGGAPGTVGIARWDGFSWSSLGGGMGGASPYVRCLEAYDGPQGPVLYAGGSFRYAGGVEANHVARWDGASWSAMPFGLDSGTDYPVHALAIYDQGTGGAPQVHAGGKFTEAGGLPASHIARYDGATWWPLGGGADAAVLALETFDGGGGEELIAGGLFTLVDDVVAKGVARWDGASWSGLAGGMSSDSTDPWVLCLERFDDGLGGGEQLYVGGRFQKAGGVYVNSIARWDGTGWSPLGIGMAPGDYRYVRALAVHDDGSGGGPALYAGGYFFAAGGVPASFIARWDGATWSAVGGGMDSDVRALVEFDDGSGPELYAGGSFHSADGTPVHRVARWDGTKWSALAGGVSGGLAQVRVLAVHDDGSGPALFVGGSFTHAGGVLVDNVAKWDGATWSPLDGGTDGVVYALESYDDGTGGGPRLFVGGSFEHAGGAELPGLAMWDGGAWSGLGGGMVGVGALAVWDDGAGGGPDLYVGGGFESSPAGDGYLARWGGCADGAPGTAYCFGDGAACPCGNSGGGETGCANSTGTGARLEASGSDSHALDDLTFAASGLVPQRPALLFAARELVNGGMGSGFGDGLLCAGVGFRRLGVESAGLAGDAAWGPGLAAEGGWLPGDTRRFQVWYRDPTAGPCGSGFNLSNGYEVSFRD